MMKNRVVYISLFFIALIAIDQVGGRALDSIRDCVYAANPSADKTYYVAHGIDADIVVMGSSGAVGAYDARQISDSTGMTVYNAAISGHFSDYQCCLLHLMLQHHTPKYIIWEIGEFSLSDEFANVDYQGALDIYPYYDADEYVSSYIDRKDCWQALRMLSRLYRHNGKLANYVSVARKGVRDSLSGFEPLPATGYEYPVLKEITESSAAYDASFSQTRYDTLCNTIRNCQQHGVKVIITTSPRFTKAKLRETLLYRKLIQLASECNCEFIDFVQVDCFLNDNTLFHDEGHMNSRGAELYMKLFIPRLKSIL